MSNRKILTIGFELASSSCENATFRSNYSLLDWDIILFKPDISDDFNLYRETYQGKPCLDEDSSFRLKECCDHWRREIKQAVEAGKTVLVFLSESKELHIDTGQRSYSGTGRNQKTTRHVAPYSNYNAIPARLEPVAATGKAMKLSHRFAEFIASYWNEFQDVSSFKVVLEGENIPAIIVTRSGEKPVGAIYRSKSSPGSLLLLPDIDFFPESFSKTTDDGEVWTDIAEQFAARMIKMVVSLDKALRSSGEVTPEPEWASHRKFALSSEKENQLKLLEIENEIEKIQRRKDAILEELKSTIRLRGLLFEKGRPLENVIIQSLQLFGFQAEPFQDAESEFDVIFESCDGRLIGEAEGKDGKAINVEKLRQLAMNIHEDLQKETVSSPAKPVLFGNAFRLQPLSERKEPFTTKCISAASASSTALVFTPDLFKPVQYLIAFHDDAYAKKCREALLVSIGRVSFPPPPEMAEDEITQVETGEV
ncbi:MAG: hypothetical protein ABIM40_10990 [Pseudomonadota bacterium]